MNLHLQLENDGWESSGSLQLSVLGTVFFEGAVLGPDQLESDLVRCSSTEEYSSFLSSLNGHFALVLRLADLTVFAVDRLRSFPLFFSIEDEITLVSDSAEVLRSTLDRNEFDECSSAEFAFTGYVTGNKTLFAGIKQLRAGEFAVAESNLPERELIIRRYYSFLHTEPELDVDQVKLGSALDAAARKAIKNLIIYADGRQIVLPLSGGYDSRLIATLLVQSEYPNLVSFAYGTKGHRDAHFSREVAKALGINWIFLEYTSALWSAAFDSRQRRCFDLMASGWTSLPHYQDWLAVKMLRERSLVDDNAIIVPGHTGDFIAGGHIPRAALESKVFSRELLFNEITHAHYNLVPDSPLSSEQRSCWRASILEEANLDDIRNGIDLAAAFQQWEWQERQSKYVVNAVRVYEFFDFDWWLPLWDKAFMDFWVDIPLRLRFGRSWYIEYVRELYNNQTNRDMGNAGDGIWIRNPVLARVKGAFPASVVRQMARARKLLKKRQALIRLPDNDFAFSPNLNAETTRRLYAEGYSLNGIAVQAFLMENSKFLPVRNG